VNEITIISGGQTGADRAALDWALDNGIKHGGWCPKGRLAEDGVIDERYQLKESASKAYPQRTEWNVRDSDGTVIFTISERLSGGSKKTMELTRQHQKPCMHVWRCGPVAELAQRLRVFMEENNISVLNVAGSRGSKEPEVGQFVQEVLRAALQPD